MANVLVICGHPDPEHSLAGGAILEALLKSRPQAQVRVLSELCGAGGFDVAAEQKALAEADVIVWQFPLYWYTVPAVMKAWFEQVLTYGFAFGSGGTALKGKKVIISLTAGADAEQYVEGGAMGFPMEAFLPPILQTARLCSMDVAGSVWMTGASYIEGVHAPEVRTDIEERARRHAARLVELLEKVGA